MKLLDGSPVLTSPPRPLSRSAPATPPKTCPLKPENGIISRLPQLLRRDGLYYFSGNSWVGFTCPVTIVRQVAGNGKIGVAGIGGFH